jgi:Fic-DOC domain mobile mystery protein B
MAGAVRQKRCAGDSCGLISKAPICRVSFSSSPNYGVPILRNANLQDANLNDANLQDAGLRGADLRGAKLGTADGLTPEQLVNACGAKSTDLPSGLTIRHCPDEKSIRQNELTIVDSPGLVIAPPRPRHPSAAAWRRSRDRSSPAPASGRCWSWSLASTASIQPRSRRCWPAIARADADWVREVRDLHRHMFADVWRWAGRLRTSPRNIGIDWWEIPAALRMLLDDAKARIDQKAYPPDEIAVRFHRRLTQVHPFPNGNGRHARLIADLLVMQLGGDRLSWGQGNLRDAGETRKRYIDALHAADRHDIGPLLLFARA